MIVEIQAHGTAPVEAIRLPRCEGIGQHVNLIDVGIWIVGGRWHPDWFYSDSGTLDGGVVLKGEECSAKVLDRRPCFSYHQRYR